ncbi:MAG: DNA-processing protein DprA [Pseudomonadota bacterium]
MDINETAHYLRLHLIPGIGFKTLDKLRKNRNCNFPHLHHCSQKTLLDQAWTAEQINILKGKCSKTENVVQRALEWRAASNSRAIVCYESSQYPEALRQTLSPPLVIFCEGRLDLLFRPKLAVVGTRAPTQYAYDALNTLLPPLAFTDIVTVSGLALGVDAICHRVSLASDIATIAVLGNGIDIVYPKRHQKLYSEIRERGLLISEFVLGTEPKPFQFPRRNRLISGMASGLLITEAKLKSGTMVSVKFAIEQNKEVLAVPSSILNVNGELSHFLIQDGATPIRSCEDILSSIAEFSQYSAFVQDNEKKHNMDLASDPLLVSVGDSATSVDLIAKRTGTSVTDVLTQLLEYELRGLVASTPDGYIRLRG